MGVVRLLSPALNSMDKLSRIIIIAFEADGQTSSKSKSEETKIQSQFRNCAKTTPPIDQDLKFSSH